MGTITQRSVAAALAVVLVLALVLPDRAVAQGESAVPFLLIAPNSRASGMGEGGTGVVDDASAIFWNPGALAFLDGQEVTFTAARWLPQFNLSDLYYYYQNYRGHFDELGGTLSESITYLNLGEFQVTNSSGPTVIDKFKSYEYAVTLGYATKATDEIGVGVNLRFIHSALSPIGTEKEQGNGISSTVSFDVAMMYRPLSLELPGIGDIGKKFSLGLNLSNLGPKITYIDAAQADPLPTNLRLGLGYKVLEDEYNALTASVDFSRLLVRRYSDPNRPPDSLPKSLITSWDASAGGFKKVIVSGGLEYWYGSPRLLAIRIGYFDESQDYGNRKFLTFGAGIRYDMFGFDFSYISAPEGTPLSDTMRFTLLIAWGGAQ
jgi:hypothetical protein